MSKLNWRGIREGKKLENNLKRRIAQPPSPLSSSFQVHFVPDSHKDQMKRWQPQRPTHHGILEQIQRTPRRMLLKKACPSHGFHHQAYFRRVGDVHNGRASNKIRVYSPYVVSKLLAHVDTQLGENVVGRGHLKCNQHNSWFVKDGHITGLNPQLTRATQTPTRQQAGSCIWS